MRMITAMEYARECYGETLVCEECGEKVHKAVELGETFDHGSRTALLCAKCLRAALALLEKKEMLP